MSGLIYFELIKNNRLLDRHLSYLFTNNETYFNAYVSGHSTGHEGNAVCIPATPIPTTFKQHIKLQQKVDKVLNQSDNTQEVKTNSINGNLYFGSSYSG